MNKKQLVKIIESSGDQLQQEYIDKDKLMRENSEQPLYAGSGKKLAAIRNTIKKGKHDRK